MTAFATDRQWNPADLPLHMKTNGVLWQFIWWAGLPAFFCLLAVFGWTGGQDGGRALPLLPLGLAALIGWLILTARGYHQATVTITTQSIEVTRGSKAVIDQIADCPAFGYTRYSIVWTNSSDRLKRERYIPGFQFGLTSDETQNLANLLNRLREVPCRSQS